MSSNENSINKSLPLHRDIAIIIVALTDGSVIVVKSREINALHPSLSDRINDNYYYRRWPQIDLETARKLILAT